MTYKAVLFDLDGTLIDTLEDLGDSVNRVLDEKGFPTHTMDAYRYFVGDGALKLITRALPESERDNETVMVCLDAFREDYGYNWNVKTQPYKGIVEMLDMLTAHDMKMAILSNKPHEFTEQCVSEFLPKWHFQVVMGQKEPFPLKPDPSGALEVSRLLGVPPAEILYLGDTSIDMNTAKAAGMFPVGVLWGFRPAEELKESGALVLMEKPIDIMNILK
ncbi:MAG: HAD family hydrolase [Thermodesulfobacteriota bacterium]|nr:HAD family hydrolase [Thermodesulfobacteriota bacterium]